MHIFVVFRVTDKEHLGPAVRTAFPENNLQLQEDEWLVAANLTAKEVADHLGVSEGENGSAIIFKMSGYYGRATTDVWDWIKTKSEAAA